MNPVNMDIPVALNNFALLPIVSNAFLIGPNSTRTLSAVAINGTPAGLFFTADGTGTLAKYALAADMIYRLTTGNKLPTTLAEGFSLAVANNLPLTSFVLDLEKGIEERDLVAVLNTFADIGGLLDDPFVRDLIASSMKLTPKNLTALRNLETLKSFSSKWGTVYSVLLEELAQLTAPRSASFSIVTR